MPKARLVFDGDNIYTEKDARIYKLKSDISTKIDGIPGVVDSLDSTSATDALSANMGRTLQDQINSMSGTGKFLSTWDATTGLPGTNPQEDPYTYKVGDYYVVSVVGATNYKPHGGTYTQGVPSTTVETENVGINDKYYFDGADWVRIPDTSIQISIDSALSTTSTNAVENRAIANAVNAKQDIISDLSTIRTGAGKGATALQPNDNISQLTNNVGYQTAGDVAAAIAGKQDILSAGDGISITSNTVTNTKPGAAVSNTAPANPTEGLLWYDTVNDVLKSYDGSNWNEVGSDAADINTKTFYLASSSDLTSAQAAYDWYVAGNNPIIVYDDEVYEYYFSDSSELRFANNTQPSLVAVSDGSTSHYQYKTLSLNITTDSVTSISFVARNKPYYFLETNVNYTTPYVPQYNGSPATKKYVDDSVADVIPSGSTAPANPQEGDLWYDTVNHVLKIYNGTSWETVDTDSDTTYTAGNGINIDANNEISVDTTVVATQNDLAGKQDILTAGSNIQISAQNVISATDTTYTAGNNIQISAQNVISATGTTYTAGEGISILNGDSYSAMRGPCLEGFHIPTIDERRAFKVIMDGLNLSTGNNWKVNLHMPFTGYRSYLNVINNQGSDGYYWSVSPRGGDQPEYARDLYLNSGNSYAEGSEWRASGMHIRPFKDTYEVPTSSWTVVSGTLGSAGIFWNQTDGLISITSDGTTGYTITDKNLGATTVYNDGDALSQANMGNMYQWGNNYGFLSTGDITSSSTSVDASGYGPGNYYDSDTFIKAHHDWSSTHNDNLWGGITGVVHLDNAITNTGVTSVNGQTGDVVSAIVSNIMPSKPKEGMLWYDTANSTLKIYYNGNWVNV